MVTRRVYCPAAVTEKASVAIVVAGNGGESDGKLRERFVSFICRLVSAMNPVPLMISWQLMLTRHGFALLVKETAETEVITGAGL